MIQNLRYYWRLNLLILLGVAVATAVLSGALLVGDAMRGSLRDMTLERLGQIDQVLSADHFFPANLATRIGQDPAPNSAAPQSASLVLVPGNVFPADKKGLAGGVNIIGIGPDFTAFFHNDSLLAKHLPLLTAKSKSAFPTVLINRHLAETLNLGENAELLLSFERHSSLDRESLFGRKEADEVLQFLRVRVAGILPDRHAGRFGLAAAQFVPYNLFMDIGILQEALGVGEGANTILLSGSNGQRQRLNPDSALAPGWLLTDGGLTLKKVEGGYSLESENYILPPAVARKGATVNSPAPPMGILTYLANRMRVGDREIPYSTVSAIDLTCSFAGNRLLGSEGNAVPDIKPGRILLNQWAANALQAAPGDILTLTYYQVGGNDSLAEAKENFTIAGIVRMEELGGDSTLSPTYPGIGDATHIRDWDPPFRMDLERIGPADEAYWDQWKGTPKAFISLAQGQALWGNRFGNLTALRFGTPDGQQDSLHTELFRVLTPADMGFSLFPVRQKGLEGAIGATDFSGLFIGFSFFLIIAAAMLVAMLFRLNLEQRHREIGVLLAAGFSIKTITRRFLGEGAMLAILGGLLGTVLAVGFAQMMVVGLRSVWLGAVGTTFITLHLSWASLLLGLGITVAIMLVTIRISLRQLRKIQVSGLLSGVNELREISAAGKSRIAGMVLLVLALLLAAYGIRSAVLDAALFYATGFLLLWAGLLLTRAAMKGRDRGRPIARPGFLQIAAINLRRKPGRSILAIALVAFATFMIVSVGANRRSFDENDLTRTSGTGGYSLIGKSAVPVFRNLNSEQVRFDMGFPDSTEAMFRQHPLYALRLREGDDASCLNLFQPQNPRIAGLPEAFLSRGGFGFQNLLQESENPWQDLLFPVDNNTTPAFVDAHSAQYILHKSLGDTLIIQARSGPVNLKIIGLLQTSIFQSEILISEPAFLRAFPEIGGYQYFLTDVPADSVHLASAVLENVLGDFGLDMQETTAKLAAFQEVENTYLGVFQMLGGLGLLLGTLGLGVVLFRNLLERRSELAVLRAIGYTFPDLAKQLVLENILIIIWGLLLGCFSALVAISPVLLQNPQQIPWGFILLNIGAVLVTALFSSLAALIPAARVPLLPALKAE